MFYLLANWIKSFADFPGQGLFQYITFRAAGAAITALLVSVIFGPANYQIFKE